ncbi:iron-sulfur cluster biosynthesis transcriptional regulator SufR [Synechococcus sp. CBW1002]|uniref:iron-sulfur cluster biosynthesis transcriptional regulator SufR n=1 Tax=Synechococcus sp. CBW1002 TaxID=1353134 RepID=UPI0018CF2C10|nr:iron-sulfur cluster biosynthesis transcriptional regulator SufR [Synechococcus sp. CBW1002]QPN61357.1 iron-sulfur cluster biosynthesis transcriptional regulator SufR [Synechococcus sp. CBW1002]
MTAPAPVSNQASTREAALTLLLRHGHATAATLAQKLAVSVQVMRRHLRSLEEEGLVVSSPSQDGPGRPCNHWSLTASGHNQFPNGSEQFTLSLLSSMANSLPPDTIKDLLNRQAIDKAGDYQLQIGVGSLPQRLDRLVELRRREGYVAECVADDDSWVFSEYHCSVMRIAEQFPCVCDQELQMIRHTFPDCSVERVHWRLAEGHSCGFRLTPRPDPSDVAAASANP